jgi:hypothetical protein
MEGDGPSEDMHKAVAAPPPVKKTKKRQAKTTAPKPKADTPEPVAPKPEPVTPAPKPAASKPAKKPAKKAARPKARPAAPKVESEPENKKAARPKATKVESEPEKPEAKPTKKPAKKAAKPKAGTKSTKPKAKSAKKPAKKTSAQKPAKKEERTLEEQLEEELSSDEIENFQIEKVDMERLTNKVCDIIIRSQTDGMLQNLLWKRLKISSRDGSRLALRMERRGIVIREKIIEKGRWTYKLILKKTPISTESIVNAPCLNCPVEQRCSIDGEVSPRTCSLIEDWVMIDMRRTKRAK